MKKFLILPILIAPIVAYATGPATYDGDPDNATYADSDGPYETATINAGDSTTVVSASYVKGAYNDAIAAVNKVDASKQVKLVNAEIDGEFSSQVFGKDDFIDLVDGAMYMGNYPSTSDMNLISANAAARGIVYALDQKRVNAVTTWGNDTPTQLTLSNLDE